MSTQTLPLTSTDARVIEDMPFEEYAAVDALNGSSIVNMRRSPMYYRHCKDNQPQPTDALILGTYTHRLILEPNRVGDFAIWTKEMGRRFGKTWDAFKAEHAGQSIVTEAECEQMVGMAVSARKCVPIRKYAEAKGPTEVSLFWTDTVTGRAMKCRLDKWIPKSRTVFDLKTARSCQRYKFGAQSYQLGYHIKMAIQGLGVKACFGVDAHLKLGAIESKAPHESAVYNVTSDIRLQGLEELDALVKRLDECERTNTWPADEQEESDLVLPSWATAQPDTEFELDMEGAA